MKIEVDKKTTFYSPNKRLKIYDVRGIIFYDSDWVKNFGGYLTMPKGVYNTDNNIWEVDKKMNRIIPKLPKYERDLKHDFKEFVISFGQNPNKCTINHKEKTIHFDESLRDAPSFQLVFILMHERGHQYYKTEFKADHYAIRQMLIQGYTPIQILLSPLLTLSGGAYDRKRQVFKTILKKYKKNA